MPQCPLVFFFGLHGLYLSLELYEVGAPMILMMVHDFASTGLFERDQDDVRTQFSELMPWGGSNARG